ncbi:hypothetical protein BCO71171_03108 [Burkholderia contaminans]|uniref:Uncharacterized protein n=1 Tax=Burkholderia contaminans TaxID=488447 RepID=A0A6P2YBD6_9BURK|nr:hypothetical protein BCO71171_03108 [Burkholderia contaminans]
MNSYSNNYFTGSNRKTYLNRLIGKVRFKILSPGDTHHTFRQICPQLIHTIPHLLIKNLHSIYRKLNSPLNIVLTWNFSIKIIKINKFFLDLKVGFSNYHSIYSL